MLKNRNIYYDNIWCHVLRREISDELLKWKNSANKKCLLIKGARQVGKTFIIDDFARKNYANYIYINFELTPGMQSVFQGDLDVDSLVRNLSIRFPKVKFEPENLLIFLDEIQSCPNARVSLKSFSMDGRFDVIGSGSLLGLNYKGVSSYPVGYETVLELHSLSFKEFLWALGVSDDLISHVSNHIMNKASIDASILEKIEEYHRWYAVVGGMPDVVNTFIGTNSFGEVLSAQKGIIDGYMDDVSKYAPAADRSKVRNVFRSIPIQLGKTNKKFQYADIIDWKAGEGSQSYGGALSWLFDAGIISYCYNVQEPASPLTFNMRLNLFKVYMRDTGLLVSMMESGVGIAIMAGDMKINQGAIVENLIANAISKKSMTPMYFERKGRLEIDFILNIDGIVTALEVKSGNNRQSKSLDVLMSDRYNVSRGIKLEKTNVFVDERGIEHYPIFAIEFLI